MRFTLSAFSDAATSVLLDATRPPAVEPCLSTEAVDELKRTGRLLAYEPSADHSVDFAVFVDEPVPDLWRRRANGAVFGARLDVPSGRLAAAGLEYIHPEIDKDAATEHEIPPGSYRVDAFELDWTEDAEAFIASVTDPADRRLASRLRAAVGVGALLSSLTITGVGVATYLLMFQSWRAVHIGLLTLAAYWITVSVAARVLGWSAAARRINETPTPHDGDDHPTTVVFLTRLSDEAVPDPDAPPACFGHLDPDPNARPLWHEALGCLGGLIGFALLVGLPIAVVVMLVDAWFTA